MRWRVLDFAHIATTDIDSEGKLDAKQVDEFVNRCVARASAALSQNAQQLSEFQRHHLGEIFDSLAYTHQAIRELLKYGTTRPISVDALLLARLQLETLYALCLMVEDQHYIDVYLKDSWKKTYIRFLLQATECKNLPRFSSFHQKQGPAMLDRLRRIVGVTDDEVATIEHEELGKPLPQGASLTKIEKFPTPSIIVRKVTNTSRKKMLLRLYPEYQLLCSYVHGSSTQPRMLKNIFNPRSKFRGLFTSGEIEEMFQKEVAGEAIYLGYLSIVQACTELIELYPNDVELRATLTQAWQPLVEGSLVGRAIWEIRSRTLLGAVA